MSNVLLGTAISDSLGMPFETRKEDDPFLKSWDGKSFLSSQYHKLGPGQWTDDTQMTLIVAESLIENHGFNPDDLAKRYVEWIDSGKARGYGKSTFAAIQNLKNGKHWTESGTIDSYGNGTAMRAAPFGVYFRNDLYSLINVVKIDSAITHRSNEAEAGALAIALAAYFIANGQDNNLLIKIDEYLPDSKVKNQLHTLPSMLQSPAIPQTLIKIIGTSADVRQTVPAALYCYLKFKNYQEAIELAIRAGGDTDTTAAIVGALIGIRDGINGLPDDLVKNVEDKDKLVILDSKLISRNNKKYLG